MPNFRWRLFKNCSIYHALENKSLNIPKESTLPGTSQAFPYVIVADDAFPLKDYIMNHIVSKASLQKKVFNYRLSCAQRVVENAFGILAN